MQESMAVLSRSTGTFSITPTGSALGAVITGLNLDAIDPETFFAVKDALLEHLVVVVRGSSIDNDSQVRLARYFGQPTMTPEYTRKGGKVWFPGHPEIVVISNIAENGEPVGELGNSELNWHTDLAFEDVPPALSFLRALEVPETGGNTEFANMYAAYEALPPELRRIVEGRSLKHQYTHSGLGIPRYGFEDISADDVTALPGPLHPIVRTHPDTRKRTIYLGRRFGAYIMGLPVDESEDIVNQLWAIAALPGNTWAQVWQAGDMVIWDNRCTMHRRDDFPADSRRRMYRVVTVGSKPI